MWIRSLGWEEGNGNPLQYPCLGNPMGGGATVHGLAESDMTELLSTHIHSGRRSRKRTSFAHLH